ncbi:MAG: restriction modification system specificity protein [Chthonomonadaceae bacterium]|nr:restriction modification system specificity protein [Chthonomonadaceae bacterium]
MTRFVDNGYVFITEAKARELSGCEAFPGDLVFTAAGTLGQVGLIPVGAKYPRYIISNKQMRVRMDLTRMDALFAFYWFASPAMVRYIQQRNTGSSVPLINLSVLRNLPLPLPPLEEQRTIANVLGMLDDKIGLNKHMNKTLESMARAVFQSWFVDFDPVRARINGRQPFGMNVRTARTFSSSFVDSLLGGIPVGWTAETFDRTINLIGGGTPKTSCAEYWNGDLPWFSVIDAPDSNNVFVIDTEKHITQLGLNNSSARLLPIGTSIISARGTVGRCALVGKPMAMNQSCYAVRGKHEGTDYYTYFALRQAVAELQQNTHGSVFDTITRDTFASIQVVVPPPEIAQSFDRTVLPLMQRILANLHEIATLTELRDTLLPKLMSGEVRVRDEEKIVEGKIAL